MAWLSVLGECFGCGRPFTFNASRVPSVNGEPICRDCIDIANERRRAAGRPLLTVLPGAYEPEEVP